MSEKVTDATVIASAVDRGWIREDGHWCGRDDDGTRITYVGNDEAAFDDMIVEYAEAHPPPVTAEDVLTEYGYAVGVNPHNETSPTYRMADEIVRHRNADADDRWMTMCADEIVCMIEREVDAEVDRSDVLPLIRAAREKGRAT